MRWVALAPFHADHGLGHTLCLVRFPIPRQRQMRLTAVSQFFCNPIGRVCRNKIIQPKRVEDQSFLARQQRP